MWSDTMTSSSADGAGHSYALARTVRVERCHDEHSQDQAEANEHESCGGIRSPSLHSARHWPHPSTLPPVSWLVVVLDGALVAMAVLTVVHQAWLGTHQPVAEVLAPKRPARRTPSGP